MRALSLPLLLTLVLGGAVATERNSRAPAAGRAMPNDNRTPAGRLVGGVLTLALEAQMSVWYPDGDSLPGIPIEAFGEPGRLAQVPGPLIRGPRGTELRVEVRNALAIDTLTFFLAADSIKVAPGETRMLRARLETPGTPRSPTRSRRCGSYSRIHQTVRVWMRALGSVRLSSSHAVRPWQSRS